MKYTILLTSLFFGSTTFANERIQNGWTIPVENSLSRSVVELRTSIGSCTATFISKYFLLTAAHCTYRASASGSKILARDTSGKWWSMGVKRLITHPNFQIQPTESSGTYVRDDIALVEVASVFPFTVIPLTLGNTAEYSTRPNQARIYGYGKYSALGGSGTLRWGFMSAWVESISLFYGATGLAMVPEDNQALCQGDSGGPVMKIANGRRYVIGVNSLSSGCKGVSYPTSKAVIVSKYLSWMRQYVSGI